MTERLLCSIEGCGRPHWGHGWCAMHLLRFRRHGDPLTVLKRKGQAKPEPVLFGFPVPSPIGRLPVDEVRAREAAATAAGRSGAFD